MIHQFEPCGGRFSIFAKKVQIFPLTFQWIYYLFSKSQVQISKKVFLGRLRGDPGVTQGRPKNLLIFVRVKHEDMSKMECNTKIRPRGDQYIF